MQKTQFEYRSMSTEYLKFEYRKEKDVMVAHGSSRADYLKLRKTQTHLECARTWHYISLNLLFAVMTRGVEWGGEAFKGHEYRRQGVAVEAMVCIPRSRCHGASLRTGYWTASISWFLSGSPGSAGSQTWKERMEGVAWDLLDSAGQAQSTPLPSIPHGTTWLT